MKTKLFKQSPVQAVLFGFTSSAYDLKAERKHKIMRFKMAILGITMTCAISGMAQNIPSKCDFQEGQLMAMSGDNNEYFIDYKTIHKDGKGLASGNILSFFDNGCLKESGEMSKGKRHGTWKRYSESGHLVNEAHYDNGNKNGRWRVWDENGILRFDFHYKDGKRSGTWLMFDENGNLANSQIY